VAIILDADVFTRRDRLQFPVPVTPLFW